MWTVTVDGGALPTRTRSPALLSVRPSARSPCPEAADPLVRPSARLPARQRTPVACLLLACHTSPFYTPQPVRLLARLLFGVPDAI